MHVVDTGQGTPLVLLHAFPTDSRMWSPVRSELAGAARVITPDQRGLGHSPLPADGREPAMDVVAGDVLALLDDLGLERVVLGGCSMGGYAAMAVLRRAPHRVAGLLLADTRPDADDADRRASRIAMAERAEREGVSWLPDTVLPGLLAAGTPEMRSELVGRLRALVTAQPPAGVAWALRALASRPDSTEVLRAYDGPALVVVGERDVLSPPDVVREMAALLRCAELVELPGCGHLSPLEAPDDFAAAVTGLLARVAGS